MPSFEKYLHAELGKTRAANLQRVLRPVDSPQSVRVRSEGRDFVNFSSNDYLGLAAHPALIAASERAAREFGAGSGASRLICGSLRPHHDLEKALAVFKGVEAALAFATGHAAALGTIPALVGKGDVIILDRLVHASIVDAARLSGAELRIFQHNDLADLARILEWAADKPRKLIVTESVFSMDGDLAPLTEIVSLKEQHDAWLMVDEAHATGLYGAHRRGLVNQLNLSGVVEIQMGTLGKAVGAAGGFIAGSKLLSEFLVNRARSFIFSTAPVPAAAAAATAGLAVINSPEGATLAARLWANAHHLAAALNLPPPPSPIIPVILGSEEKALEAAEHLRAAGFLVPAIRFPTVKRGQARLRVTVTAGHSTGDIDHLARELTKWADQGR